MRVYCENDGCIHCQDGKCTKESIIMERRTFSGFYNGEHEWSPSCCDYEEQEYETD